MRNYIPHQAPKHRKWKCYFQSKRYKTISEAVMTMTDANLIFRIWLFRGLYWRSQLSPGIAEVPAAISQHSVTIALSRRKYQNQRVHTKSCSKHKTISKSVQKRSRTIKMKNGLIFLTERGGFSGDLRSDNDM